MCCVLKWLEGILNGRRWCAVYSGGERVQDS